EESEHEEERGENTLQTLPVAVRVTQPLPLEVIPVHRHLAVEERRLTLAQLRLAVLTAIEVVHEGVPGLLRERARHGDAVLAAGRLAFVDGGVVRGANRLRRERRHADHGGTEADENELAANERARTPDDDGDTGGERRQGTRHVIRVAEGQQ